MKGRGQIYVIAAAVLWGTTGTAQALAPEGAQPVIVGTVRLILGGLALLGFAAYRGTLREGGRWPVWTTLIAAISMAGYQLFFFAGVYRTGVAVGTIVGIGSSPIWAGIIGFLVRGERPGVKWGVATVLAIFGCILLVSAGGTVYVDVWGILLALGAGFSYAIFTVVSKRLLEEKPPETVMAVTFTIGAILMFPLLFTGDLSWLSEPGGIAVAVHLGFLTVGVGYTLFAKGLQLVPVATAATLTLAEPLTAGALGFFLLGERLTPIAFMGILLIFVGLALLTLGGEKGDSLDIVK
jgi:DME family drug/metabolite transporter